MCDVCTLHISVGLCKRVCSCVQMVYKSCPDLSRLSGSSAPVVNPDSEYRAAYKPSTEHHQLDNTSSHTLIANAAAADNSDDDDDINEVCVLILSARQTGR